LAVLTFLVVTTTVGISCILYSIFFEPDYVIIEKPFIEKQDNDDVKFMEENYSVILEEDYKDDLS